MSTFVVPATVVSARIQMRNLPIGMQRHACRVTFPSTPVWAYAGRLVQETGENHSTLGDANVLQGMRRHSNG